VGVTLIATIPMAIAVWCIGFLPAPPHLPNAEQALAAYVNVLAIGASVTVIFYLLERGSKQDVVAAAAAVESGGADTTPSQAAESTAARFTDRLPPELGTELIALEMEDHYVRAHTALGSDLVLLRLRDAIAELDGIEGRQVHRSWWVARGAVADVKREGRNVRLVLDTGLEAPVSRANVQPLKDAGWI
ncbi:LytTR family DNA-binding domain-containing protein, partial [Altererythrobacter sp.]|nr:LytTR family DNA-binding domain-containing protein [Altererythrobacter sp.]